MTRNRMVYLTLVFVLLIAGLFSWKLTRAGYETAAYTVVESEGEFQIRQYPDLMLASTDMRVDSRSGDGSFMRLFGYIRGDNSDDQRVAMTTPVFMGENGKESNRRMGFVIPQDVALAGVPEPKATNVRIRKRTGGRFAVIRFAGKLSDKKAKAAEKSLRQWIARKGLVGYNTSEAAGYDPPFTPGPLRRNEILIRLTEYVRRRW